MQNKLREVIRFDDFWVAYGPRGFVAMAWWLGAQHAQRIRREHGSFPLLHVTGGSGCGKTVLLEYLNKLQGNEHYSVYAAANTTCADRARLMANLGRNVLMYELNSESSESSGFDWRELLQLYAGGSFSVRPPNGLPIHVPFRGALAICSTTLPIQALEHRVIPIELLGFYSSQRVRESVYALSQLRGLQAGCFSALAKKHEQEIFEILGRGALAYSAAIRGDYGDSINQYQAKNYGQLMSLVDCLCLMLSLPNDQRVFVQQEVQDMVLFETTPF